MLDKPDFLLRWCLQWRRMQAVGRAQTAALTLLSASVAAFALAYPSLFWRRR